MNKPPLTVSYAGATDPAPGQAGPIGTAVKDVSVRNPRNPTGSGSESSHLTAVEASRLVAYLPSRERALLAHALHCPACQDLLDRPRLDVAFPSAPGRPFPPDYTAVLDRLEAGLCEATERIACERSQAEAAVAALLATPPEDRRKRIRHEVRFRTVSVAALLLERTPATAIAAPEEAENLALLALYVLSQLDPEDMPSMIVGELKVRGWALLARASWSRGDWRAAREALEHAEEVMVAEGYPAKRVGFRRAVAALRAVERQLEGTFQTAARAVDLVLGPLLTLADTCAELSESESQS